MTQAATKTDVATKADFERIPFGSDPALIGQIIARDGGLILTGVLGQEDVAAINRDLDPLINPLPLGNWGGEIAEGVQNDAPAAAADASAVKTGSVTEKISAMVTAALPATPQKAEQAGTVPLRAADGPTAGETRATQRQAQLAEQQPGL